MIIRSGLAATHLVTFETGFPDGDVSWQALSYDGVEVASGVITPGPGAVSVLLPISPAITALPPGIFQTSLDIVWTYEVGGATVNGEERYTLEARLPLGISPEGVRRKLGVSASELPDGEISLVESYLSFVNLVGQVAYEGALDGGLNDIRIRNAVEAQSALALVPTMPVRIAASESSGTNDFKRQTIVWAEVAAALETIVNLGIVVVDPLYTPYGDVGDLFILARPSTDAFTGATS